MKYTKDDLAKMSDFEINKALAESLGGYGGAVGDWLPDGVKLKEDTFFYTEFHFNNWNDIMPLAEKYLIASFANYDAPSIKHACTKIMGVEYYFACHSTQRAIACCLILVLQERE